MLLPLHKSWKRGKGCLAAVGNSVCSSLSLVHVTLCHEGLKTSVGIVLVPAPLGAGSQQRL